MEQQRRGTKFVRKKVLGLGLRPLLSALGIVSALLLAFSFPAQAQQAKFPRIGF
jgi:hypothetical protein